MQRDDRDHGGAGYAGTDRWFPRSAVNVRRTVRRDCPFGSHDAIGRRRSVASD